MDDTHYDEAGAWMPLKDIEELKRLRAKQRPSLSATITLYYEARGYAEPTTYEAMAWAQTEIAEAYEILLASKQWVRNHPEDHPTRFDAYQFGKELGDAVMMLLKAGFTVGVDPLVCLEETLRRIVK
jgi:hypothetical protein